jgi:hypothetical protein
MSYRVAVRVGFRLDYRYLSGDEEVDGLANLNEAVLLAPYLSDKTRLWIFLYGGLLDSYSGRLLDLRHDLFKPARSDAIFD